MKLRRIEIENFRGFATPFDVEVDDFTAFIGPNDIGKSSILAALTIFLEGDGVKIEQNDGCIHGNPSTVRITCEFDELPDKVILDDQFETSLGDEHLLRSNGRLRITKSYDCTKSKIAASVFINAEKHPIDKDGKSLLPLTLPDLKKLAAAAKVELETGEATVKAKVRRAIVERSKAFSFGPADIPVGKNESQTLWDQILKHLPMCALFVSDRSSTDKDKEAQTPMGIAVEVALSEVQADLDRLATHVEKRVQMVADRTLAKLNEMNSELASALTASLKERPKWKDLFKYTLNSNAGVPMDKRGSGVRRLVLLNFFRAEAERKAASEGERPIIYAMEEPETSQHPDHQKMLVRALIEISEKGGQVLITTHAPGLAGEVSVNSLRFIDDGRGGNLVVRSAATEEPSALFGALAERLGMLPDNQVRVLICVEGMNDVRFLKHVSHTLNVADPNLPDLSSDHRFVFIPMHGGNLRDVVNQHLFRNFRKPEFHIYDRDGGGTYAAQEAEVKARGDGSTARQTQKRYLESYIHPAAIKRVTGETVDVGDDEDYTVKFGCLLKVKKSEAKFILAEKVTPAMTVEEIDKRDGKKEIRGWLAQLSKMASH
ncbi:MAG: ATP-binding protein [Verrucomicrobia bacterium]|nr:ATP-binding protein [Verrucomicrobiota bacterium]